MAECLVSPYLESIGPELAVVRATFRTDPGVSSVTFGWHTYTCMQDQALWADVKVGPGQQSVDVTCQLPVTKVVGFAETEPIRFELKCSDTELWGKWFRPAQDGEGVILVETRGDIPERCRL